jgi:hypothetical protein
MFAESPLHRSRAWLPLVLFVAAFVIRLWYSGPLLIAGDDYSSLLEAQHIGKNLQGLPYFLLLSFWTKVSTDPLWIHALSALISALAVAACWYWLRMRGTFVALAASLFLLVSSYAISESVTVRYYGLYLLASLLFYSAYWNILLKSSDARTTIDWLVLLLTIILLILSQLLGALVVSLVIIHAARYLRGSASRWLSLFVTIGLIAGIGIIAAFIVIPQFRSNAYLIFSRIIASSAQTYEGPRGWSLSILAKAGFLLFSFAIGPTTYVLDWSLVIPAHLLTFVFGLLGIARLSRERSGVYLFFCVIVGLLGITLVYGGLDPLLPRSFHDSAAPRTVYFSLPIVFWIIAEGIAAIRSLQARWIALSVFVVLQGIALIRGDNSPGLSSNWPEIAAQIASASTKTPSAIWTDDMAGGPAELYFGNKVAVQDAYELVDRNTNPKPDALEAALRAKRFVFLAFDAREPNRCIFDSLISAVAARSYEVLARVNYPVFFYAFDPVPDPEAATRGVRLPPSIFPMELQDLDLPRSFTWKNQTLTITGVYTLPNCKGTKSVDIPDAQFDAKAGVESVLLLTNLTRAEDVSDGSIVAQLTLVIDGQENETIPLRKGYETQSWNSSCLATCWSIMTWHKRIALVGNQAFPGAYEDFQAHVWAVEIPMPSRPIRSLQLKLLDEKAHLNVFGLYFA